MRLNEWPRTIKEKTYIPPVNTWTAEATLLAREEDADLIGVAEEVGF